MPRAQIAYEHWRREQAGEAEKVLVNLYGEVDRSNPKREARLVTTPGTRDRDTGDVMSGNIRGMAQEDAFADGKVLILNGTTLRTWVPSTGTFGTITGTVAGSDRADMAISMTELAILSGGTIYVSAGTTIAAATDVDFPSSITSVAVNSQRLILTAGDGRFWYSSVLDFDNLTALNFYTAEASPDDLVAVRTWGEQILLFGNKTVEIWYAEPSNADDPFSRASSVVATGCLARDTISITDKGPIWIAPDRTVRVLMGVNAEVISPPWLTRALASVSAADIICSSYEAESQLFYCVNAPTFCAVLNVTAGSWHLRKSGTGEAWDWAYILTALGKQYVAKRTGPAFMELSRDYPTDEQADADTLGTTIRREFSAHVPVESGAPALGAVILESSKGIGRASGPGSAPVAKLRISNDNGNTWTAFRDASLGAQGAYSQRSVWHRNGRGRRPQVIFGFRIEEPVKFAVEGVIYGELT